MVIFYVFLFIICILLILIVLVQNSKGGGLASGFTGSQIMGVRKTADFLEKATWTLASALIFFSLLINLIIPPRQEHTQRSILQDEIQNAISPGAVPRVPTAMPKEGDQKANPAPPKKDK
jgi:preprotein translocase subunit SecG